MRNRQSLKLQKKFAGILCIYCCLFLLLSMSSRAQTNNETGLPFITNYLAKNYKAIPQTWCIQQDDRGIMYFGVQNHILEYDGVKWRKIAPANITPTTIFRSLVKYKD